MHEPHKPTEQFEKSLERLQATVRSLESGELALEDALKAFEEGVRLTRSCQAILGEAERKVELLTKIGAQGEPEFGPMPGSSTAGGASRDT